MMPSNEALITYFAAYHTLPIAQPCTCGGELLLECETNCQAVYRCELCGGYANYRRNGLSYSWELRGVFSPKKKPIVEPTIEPAVLDSIIMKLDAIAAHLNVELVNVPEHFDCEDSVDE